MSRSALLTNREQRMLPYYGRGLERMEFFLGSIKPYIENAQNTIRILEIGTGYGQVLLDLHLKFGASVELYGINLNEGNGTSETAVRVGKFLGKIHSNENIDMNFAQIVSHDAGLGLPYEDGYFDLILSQMTIIYIRDKIRLLEEACRVLSSSGTAQLHTQFERPELNLADRFSLIILRNGLSLNVHDHLKEQPHFLNSPPVRRDIITINGGGLVDLRLKLVESNNIDYSKSKSLPNILYGRRSIYKDISQRRDS